MRQNAKQSLKAFHQNALVFAVGMRAWQKAPYDLQADKGMLVAEIPRGFEEAAQPEEMQDSDCQRCIFLSSKIVLLCVAS